MVTSILIGAGAEVSAPYRIPGGQEFTWATCYTRNAELYEALEKYYAPILESSNKTAHLPRKYQDAFLYEANNTSFADLIRGVLNSKEGTAILVELVGKSFLERESADEGNQILNNDELNTLYDALIKETSRDSLVIQKLKNHLLKDLPEDAYYGTIEGYFSSLLNPSRRNKAFWKLINYYWSAFFAVSAPLIEAEFAKNRLFKTLGLYQFTLANLHEVLQDITADDYLDRLSSEAQNYYTQLSGLFDYALTTNYTPFVKSMMIKDDRGPIRLSGSITQFEAVPDLCVYDLLEDKVSEGSFLFPFVMTQVPVKPLIDYRQMREYSRAIRAFDESDAVVIIGYSLCQNDAHIGSLLRAYLDGDRSKKLIYLDYRNSESTSVKRAGDILERIRMSEDRMDQVSVITFGECGEIAADELRACLESVLASKASTIESKATS